MSSSAVKVLGAWQSPFVLRVRIALNIKSVAYEYQHDEILAPKSEILLKSNPVHKKIPVFFHDHKPICESLVIVQYIDEVWASGPAILPSDPYDRAMARFWAAYIDNIFFEHLRGNLLKEGEELKQSIEETSKGLLVLEKAFVECSGGRKFFQGDEIGFVDIALGSILAWMSVIAKTYNLTLIDKSKTPNLFKWAQRFSSDASVKDLLPDVDELFRFSKRLVALRKGSATL